MLFALVIPVIVLFVGFLMLIRGADIFVEGSSAIAKRFRIPPLVIGLTIAAMGTSLPEFAVSVSAALTGHNEVAVSNVTGSNLFNLLMAAGACAIIAPLTVQRQNRMVEFPICIGASILMAVFGATGIAAEGEIGSIGLWKGSVFLLLFVIFLLYTVHVAMKSRAVSEENGEGEILPLGKSIFFILAGLVAIKLGGDFVVGGDTSVGGIDISYGAVAIAQLFGMSDTLIGLTIVAVGTSLPELVTSIAAARKNEVDMAIGNVLGSNIFNVLLILGATAVISPISFVAENLADVCFMIFSSVLVWIFTWTGEKLVRWEGAVMVICYAAFLVYAVARVYIT